MNKKCTHTREMKYQSSWKSCIILNGVGGSLMKSQDQLCRAVDPVTNNIITTAIIKQRGRS